MYLIDKDIPIAELTRFLNELGWLPEDESIVALSIPGEGNMNMVLRVQTNLRSFILKQSRPYVRKYPLIEAPQERIHTEYLFLKSIEDNETGVFFPQILNYDQANYLLQLEDLGDCQDLTYLYNTRNIDESRINHLVQLLSTIHHTKKPVSFPQNMPLRKLNHAHIFVLPFQKDNGFDLDEIQPGLQDISMDYKTDRRLTSIVTRIGEKYLDPLPGKVLLHGDYYPGSWLTNGKELLVIDPEFAFVGFPEYDLGVMAAHLYMIGANKKVVSSIISIYDGNVDPFLIRQVMGIEIMRRIIGLAQLPLERSLNEKEEMLSFAYKNIIS